MQQKRRGRAKTPNAADMIQRVLFQASATVSEIAEKIFREKTTVHNAIRSLRGNGRVRVVGYIPSGGRGRSSYTPIYALGSGEDTPPPSGTNLSAKTPEQVSESQKRVRAQKRARYSQNPDRVLERNRAWYAANKSTSNTKGASA
jgi:hypothetical protein